MRVAKSNLILAFLLPIFISCAGNEKSPFDFSYEKSYQLFHMKNVEYPLPDICKPELGGAVLLSDKKGVFFEDTVYTLGMIRALNCSINKLRDKTTDEDSLKALIINNRNYISAIQKIEDVSRLNNLLKKRYKIKQEPSDSMQMENLIRLIIDTQFERDTDREKYMHINKRQSWIELLKKHNKGDLSDSIILSILRPDELLSMKEIRKILNNKEYYSNRQLLFSYNFTYDPSIDWSSYYEIIIRYELYLDSDGYLQLRKYFENIFYLLKPSSIE